jgi:hypothetical protein
MTLIPACDRFPNAYSETNNLCYAVAGFRPVNKLPGPGARGPQRADRATWSHDVPAR